MADGLWAERLDRRHITPTDQQQQQKHPSTVQDRYGVHWRMWQMWKFDIHI